MLIDNDIHEITSYKPNWIIKKANAILFLVLSGSVAIIWFIQYPEIVTYRLQIYAKKKTESVLARKEGRLQTLLVSNYQEVSEGQPLAYFRSIACPQQISCLQKWLINTSRSISKDSLEILHIGNPPSLSHLGELQAVYMDFEETWKETSQLFAVGFPKNHENCIIDSNRKNISPKHRKLLRNQKQKLYASFFLLNTDLEKWIAQFVVTAPANGKILFASLLHENKFVSSGQELFYLEPFENEFFGQLKVPNTQSDKIKKGQKVLIQIDGYSHAEFGYLPGTIGDISNINTDGDSSIIKVNLPKGLTTSFDKKINFRSSLFGQAQVITDKNHMFARVLNTIRKKGL